MLALARETGLLPGPLERGEPEDLHVQDVLGPHQVIKARTRPARGRGALGRKRHFRIRFGGRRKFFRRFLGDGFHLRERGGFRLLLLAPSGPLARPPKPNQATMELEE